MSRNTNYFAFVALGFVLLVPMRGPGASAQESLDSRYQKAVDLFNQAKMEEACELFQQVASEKPGYKDIQTYLNPACNSAKQTYALEERLFNQGVDLFKQEKVDDAKLKFEQADKLVLKHPKYRAQIEGYLKQIEARSGEEALFQQAVKLFNDGKVDEAAKQFAQLEQSKAKSAEARTYLERIRERREETTWNRAVDFFAQGDLASAKPLFQQVAQMKGKRTADAQAYLGRIEAADADQRAYGEAVKAFNDKRYDDAKTRFESLTKKGGTHTADTLSYLQRIEEANRVEIAAREVVKKKLAEQPGQDPKLAAQQFIADARANMSQGQYIAAVEKLKAAEILDPGDHEVRALLPQAQELADEQPLREGLAAYFQGKYDDAERDLGQYVENHGRKMALAYFFRGASHASRYYLSGEHDAHQKELAFGDFHALQKQVRQFQPPKDYVSPKILSLYAEALSAPAK